MKREDCYAGLFALLQPLFDNGTLKRISRRLEFAEDAPAENTPGVWQVQIEESKRFDTFGGFAGWTLVVDWYVYITQSDETQPSSPIFNPIMDAVTGVLPNDVTGTQLIVSNEAVGVVLRDKIRPYEGLLNNKAVIVIPLALIVADALIGD